MLDHLHHLRDIICITKHQSLKIKGLPQAHILNDWSSADSINLGGSGYFLRKSLGVDFRRGWGKRTQTEKQAEDVFTVCCMTCELVSVIEIGIKESACVGQDYQRKWDDGKWLPLKLLYLVNLLLVKSILASSEAKNMFVFDVCFWHSVLTT